MNTILTRKQQWRRAGHGNKYLRNMDMDTYFNNCEIPIRAYSDTALPTRMEDIKTTSHSPLRSSITTGNMHSLKNCPPMKGLSTKKKVNFDICVRVILITSRAEYVQAGLYSTLWYKHDDYIEFKKETLKDLAGISMDILWNAGRPPPIQEIGASEQGSSQTQVNDNTEGNKWAGSVDIDNTNTQQTSSNSVWEKRNAFSYESGLDRLGEMFKARDGIEAEQDDHTTILKSSSCDRDHISSREETELINSIVEKGEEDARKQAALSRRLVEEQKNNKQYVAKNPMTLMCM